MLTESQKAELDQIAEESVEFGVRDQLSLDPCDWINVFDYAEGWARARGETVRMLALRELSARTAAVLDEATAPC